MSNIPTPKEIPPTPQQVDATLRSVITASQTLINTDPRHYTNLRATFMQFYSHPTFQLILGLPTQNTPTVTRGLRVLREQLFLRLLLTTCRASKYTLDLESCLGMLRQS
jgi:hypothetical protein